MKKLLFIFILTLSSHCFAQWYSPFKSKKTPEDCILEKIKDVRGEDAIGLLTRTCWDKYGGNYAESTPSEKKAYKLIQDRKNKCRIPEDAYKFHFYFVNYNGSLSHKEKNVSVISNLKNRKIEINGIEFQNNNHFGISGVMIGFTNSKQCPSKLEDYDLTSYCSNYTTESGVNRTSYGKIQCNFPKASIGKGFCILGYSPTYDKFNDSLLEFAENNGLCRD
jgi:hypothetical protein